MNSDTPVATRGHWLLWAAGSWLAALVLTFAGFVGHFHSGPWFAATESYAISGSELAVRGESKILGSGVVIERAGEDGNAIAMRNFSVPLEARKFRIVSVRATGASPVGGVTFAWRIRGDERRIRKIELVSSGGRILPATLGSVDGWTGEVVGLALIARGDFRAPLVIESLELHPSSVWTTIAGIVSGWLEFEPWDGGSINFIAGGNPSLKHPLSLFVGITFVVATGLYLLLVALGYTRFKLQAGLAVALLCWAIVDLRWQLNLWQQLQLTRLQYAGKGWEEKRLAAEDGRLFAFMREVNAKIGPGPAHVFVFADEEYDRVRGAYHLYPRNVSAQSKRQALLPAATFKAGDVLVLYRKRGVAYDPAQRRLLWEDGQSLLADMLYMSDGAAVLRVLGPG